MTIYRRRLASSFFALARTLDGHLRAIGAPGAAGARSDIDEDLPDDDATTALLTRRHGLGLSTAPDALVLVDHLGRSYEPDAVPMALRRARSTRISIDGNAHFCRGLLGTRYGDEPPAFVALQASPSPVSKKGTRS